ncbi:MAG: hypothetical protein HGA45_26850 [Chloroflexales bacterium]|nr:hypothetical protein [Chloroflexales bacterium]
MQSQPASRDKTPVDLIARLADASPREWWQTVGHLAAHGVAAVPDLSAALSSPHRSVRQGVAQSLGRIGQGARSAAHALVQALFDADAGVRADAAWALVRVSAPLRWAVPIIAGRLAAEEASAVRRRRLRLAGHIGPPAQPMLGTILEDLADERLAADALVALCMIAPQDAMVHDVLMRSLQPPHTRRAALAAEAIGRMRLATPALRAALEVARGSSNRMARHAARVALLRLSRARLR